MAVQFGAAAHGQLGVTGDGALGEDQAGLVVVQDAVIARQFKLRESLHRFRRIEQFMGEIVLADGAEAAFQDGRAGRAEHEAAGDENDGAAQLGGEVFPQGVGAAEEGDVVGMLEIGEPDHAGESGGGAHGVGDVEAIQAQDAGAATG